MIRRPTTSIKTEAIRNINGPVSELTAIMSSLLMVWRSTATDTTMKSNYRVNGT